MASDKSEKKTRQRLTITAMYSAILDIEAAVRTSTTRVNDRSILLSELNDGRPAYVATLCATDPDSTKIEHIAYGESREDFDGAVAALLEDMKKKLEAKKKELLSGLDDVLAKHHGALRGARSKIRENKT